MVCTPWTSEYADYLRDESRQTGEADCVAFARSEADVLLALKEARASGWPVTVQGARTGITAGAVPRGGLILNLSRMNRIEPLQNRRIRAQPGARLSELRAAVEPQGFFFPPDPTETSASIGGMLACNASGALSYHYGPTRRWIRSLRVALADGDLLQIRRGDQHAQDRRFTLRTESGRTVSGLLPELEMPAVKHAAGYYVRPDMDLLDLFIGMEGTLGVITEAEFDVIAMPPIRQALTAFFPAETAAVAFVRFLRGEHGSALPATPVAIEFFDAAALDLLRRSREEKPAFAGLPALPHPCGAAIYVELHGADEASMEAAVLAAADAMHGLGADADTCWFADQGSTLDRMKTFRHATPEAVNLLIDERRKTHPDLTKLGTDMSVPGAAIETILARYHGDLDAAGLESVIFGHIGDNHVHVNILPRNREEYDAGKALYLRWAAAVAAMGGSVSAEHGIGKLKTPLLEVLYGEAGVREMRRLKTLLDPDALLNPGNLFACERGGMP